MTWLYVLLIRVLLKRVWIMFFKFKPFKFVSNEKNHFFIRRLQAFASGTANVKTNEPLVPAANFTFLADNVHISFS